MSNDTAIASLKEKIDDLNQQAWEVRVTDLPKAFELSQESVKLARSIDYTKGLAEGLRSLGFSYVRFSKNDEAVPLLKESLSLFQSLNDLKGQAVVYEYMGIIERNKGNLGTSLELLLKGNNIVGQTGPLEVEVTTAYHIGVTYKHLGNYENALDHLYRALSLAKEINLTLMEGYAINIIGSIYFDNGDYNQALDCYQQGLIIRQQSHDKWGEAGSLDNIGFTYLKLNDLDKAIEYCKQSLAISQGAGDKKGEANALLHLAEINEQAGDIKQAAGFSNESLEIRKARGDKRGETEVLLFLADLYKNRKDVEDHQIFEWLSGALKIADEIKAQDLLSKAYYNLHEYYQQKGNFKESLVQLEAHFQIEKELHKNSINQKISNLEISHKAEVISQRNKELIELNEKIEKANEELKIEASLERVRVVAMSMKKPDDLLSICKILFTELEVLGIKELRNAMINIYNDEKNTFLNYDFSGSLGQSITVFSMTHSHAVPDYITKQIRQSKSHFAEIALTGDQLAGWIEFREKNGELPDPKLKNASTLCYYFYSVGMAAIGISTLSSITKEEHVILMRFRNVFDLAYKRYADINQAEAQAKEAKIEAALERVRARTMGMHKSDELAEVAMVLFEQISLLDNTPERFNIRIANEAEGVFEFWATDQEGHLVNKFFRAAFDRSPVVLQMYTSWKAKEKILIQDLHGDQLSEWVHYIKDVLGVPFDTRNLKEHRFLSSVFFSHGMIGITTNDTPNPVTLQLIERFAKVFEQTYRRFLDLQKAEAQAREAQIELGLERVRARAMAMQKSDELKELIGTVSTELSKLDLILDRCFIAIFDAKTDGSKWWMSSPETPSSPTGLSMQYHEMPPYLAYLEAWKTRQLKWQYILEGDNKKEWDEFIFNETEFSYLPDFVIVNMRGTHKVFLNASFNSFGCLTLATLEPLSDEQFDIMLRFAKVFDLTYTRFNDLKQAEAQAREAQIELGLEKVRAKAMAMHKSDDLRMAVATVFEELEKLNIGILRCGIAIMDKEKPRADVWITVKSEQTSTIQVSGDESLDYHPLLRGAYDGWVKQEDFSYVLQGEDLLSYYRDVASIKYQLPVSTPFDKGKIDQQQYYFNAVFQDGSLFAFMETAFTDEAKMIVKRFANVFNLTYKRFLDLQKAEAQAREARIEAALEKVRASTMAMQRSSELSDTAYILLQQFKTLEEVPEQITIGIMNEEEGVIEFWVTYQGNKMDMAFKFPIAEPVVVNKIYSAWKENKRSLVIELEGEELHEYIKSKNRITGITHFDDALEGRRVINVAYFSKGMITVSTADLRPQATIQLLERFAGVFDLTYTRFLDLQKAEAQAREAKIETALERVRARALAMQEPEELKEVAQVLRTEMGLLGVEELETCSIYINDESAEKAECWYALKDIRSEEKKLVNDHFALNLNDTWVGREMLQFYQSPEKQISIVMQGDNRKEWIRYCEVHSAPFRGYYGEAIPDRTYHLYKFSHGAIGAAAAGDISEESWRMLRRAASVFSLAYSRFKDLTQARTDLVKLKEEKKRAEDTLTELQATQKQLIQAEKMASLGELTAGIAHEIQNPLNFVNNFSDVSNELLEEMKTELEKGNAEGAKEIAIDVKENLEKILHHGKRADAIVKGMLQHSRSSAGQKELTDINTLADEYLRLAYHGLRAKDKFFNAKFETDLDPSITKISIVPQEIGRVILNLINNSFYAVNEKKKLLGNGFEPTVTVTTKVVKPPLGGLGAIEIKVKDNGNGIPQKVLDKIFQPFFTTKPTGQGTGLGLSLSYDIVTKGHDGEIKVETKEGEGSAFTISLPMK
jgi:signal transduction histidine kinase/tetratricopeptide (TPR) repeat protein